MTTLMHRPQAPPAASAPLALVAAAGLLLGCAGESGARDETTSPELTSEIEDIDAAAEDAAARIDPDDADAELERLRAEIEGR